MPCAIISLLSIVSNHHYLPLIIIISFVVNFCLTINFRYLHISIIYTVHMGIDLSSKSNRHIVHHFFSRNAAKASIMIGCLCLSMASGSAYAQSSGNAGTRVLAPVTITNVNELNFGRIIPGSIRSVIRMGRNSGDLTVRNGNAVPIGGTVQRAEFIINADPLTSVQITLPTTLDIIHSSGSDDMRLNRFRLNGRGGRIASRNIDNSGILSILVSGQLRVLPNQTPGLYSANYDVTVEYN